MKRNKIVEIQINGQTRYVSRYDERINSNPDINNAIKVTEMDANDIKKKLAGKGLGIKIKGGGL